MSTMSRLRLLLPLRFPLWSLWHLVLTGCLCLAIPVQGYAATSKVLCPHHAADHGASHSQGHEHLGAHAEVSQQSATTSPHATSDCSQCGDCCPGLAPMPGQSQPAATSPPAHAAPTVAPAPAPSFLTSGLDRPPRRKA